MVRDKAFYGFKPDNIHLKTTKKSSVPWIDVSDGEVRVKQRSMKRKASSALNGQSYHAQNGQEQRKQLPIAKGALSSYI